MAEQHQRSGRMLGADQRMKRRKIVEEVRKLFDRAHFAAGTTVAAVVEGMDGDAAGRQEATERIVAAAVLAHAVGQYQGCPRRDFREPGAPEDRYPVCALKGPFGRTDRVF